MLPNLPEPDPIPGVTPGSLDDDVLDRLLNHVDDRLRNHLARSLAGIEVNPRFEIRGSPRDIARHSPPAFEDCKWVWALSGGGAKGAFQFGAMLYLSHDVRLLPKGIASTSVGSINLVGAAEASQGGLEKLKRNWLAVQNLHDMYAAAPWMDEMDRLETLRRRGISIQHIIEGSTPRTLHPHPESLEGIDSVQGKLNSIISSLPTDLETVLLNIGNWLLLGIPGIVASPELLDSIREIIRDLKRINSRLRDDVDGIWQFHPLRERMLMMLDLDAIRRAGTHLRIVVVSLNDTSTYDIDEQLRLSRYSVDRLTGKFVRTVGRRLRTAVDYDGRPLPNDDRVLFTQAVLASASIPLVNPPIRLGEEPLDPWDSREPWLSRHPLRLPPLHYMMDGGIREILPINQAINILETDLAEVTGRKGIISIGTGKSNPVPSDYILPELAPEPFDPERFPLLAIGQSSLQIAIEEILTDEERIARFGLPDGVSSLTIAPSFLLGETTDIDPGIVQISIAYGWMTAFDRLKQVELGLSPEEYRVRLWLNTNLIAQMRYAAWKLEREGTSFFHEEHRALFGPSFVLRVSEAIVDTINRPSDSPGTIDAGSVISGVSERTADLIPHGWIFKEESYIGSQLVNVLTRIRELKRLISRQIESRIAEWGLDSLPSVHDLSNFGGGNENCFVDWYRHWERHAVQPNTGSPTGPGLIHPDGQTVTAFGRYTTPWDARPRYHIGDINTFPLERLLPTASEVNGIDVMPSAGTIRHTLGNDRVYGISPMQVGFDLFGPEPRERTAYEREPDYATVRLEGYIHADGGAAPPGTTPLNLLWSERYTDHFTTSLSSLDDYAFVRQVGHIFSPHIPQPSGTVPLVTWFSPSRLDHLTTSDSWRFIEGNPLERDGWQPVRNIEPDYEPLRLEGFVYPPDGPQPEGTEPLYRWISFSRRDNQTGVERRWWPTEPLVPWVA